MIVTKKEEKQALTNFDIEKIAKTENIQLDGIFPINEIDNITKTEVLNDLYYILNKSAIDDKNG